MLKHIHIAERFKLFLKSMKNTIEILYPDEKFEISLCLDSFTVTVENDIDSLHVIFEGYIEDKASILEVFDYADSRIDEMVDKVFSMLPF